MNINTNEIKQNRTGKAAADAIHKQKKQEEMASATKEFSNLMVKWFDSFEFDPENVDNFLNDYLIRHTDHVDIEIELHFHINFENAETPFIMTYSDGFTSDRDLVRPYKNSSVLNIDFMDYADKYSAINPSTYLNNVHKLFAAAIAKTSEAIKNKIYEDFKEYGCTGLKVVSNLDDLLRDNGSIYPHPVVIVKFNNPTMNSLERLARRLRR